MPKRSELGELVRAEPEADRDRAQIAARYYRSLGYRVRVFARMVRAEGDTHPIYLVTVRRRRNESAGSGWH